MAWAKTNVQSSRLGDKRKQIRAADPDLSESKRIWMDPDLPNVCKKCVKKG